MDSAASLELSGVFAGYGETVVLEDVRLAMREGETVSIIGRNGVGKTTLLATVMGHTTLHGGTIAAARSEYHKARAASALVGGARLRPSRA